MRRRPVVDHRNNRSILLHYPGQCLGGTKADPLESYFHTLETELVMHCDYLTRH